MSKGEEGFCPFAYQGQIIDKETGLYYNRFRYYSPEEGLYISQDPIGLAGGDKFYGYVKDPNTWIDPLGLSSCHESGDRGRNKAKKEIEDAGLVVIGEEITLNVSGKNSNTGNIRADFIAVDPVNGNIHVIEAKNGESSYTTNQAGSNVFNKNNLSSTGSGLDISKGTNGNATIATGNTKKTNVMEAQNNSATGRGDSNFGKGSSHDMTFHTAWYND